MQYFAPILVAIGGFLGLGGILLLLEARKIKEGVDNKDKKSNIVGSVFLFMVAVMLISGGVSVWLSAKKTENSIGNTGKQTQQVMPESPAAQEQTRQTQPTLEQTQGQQKKQEAEKAVKSFAQVQKAFQYVLTSYQSEIKDISNGTMAATGYNDLERLSQQNLDLFRDARNMDIAKQYTHEKQIMVTAVLYLQGSIDNLKSYINDKKVGKFTEAQDYLQKAIEANKLVTIGVTKQALLDGYNPPQGKETQ
ncbi:MAG: hypothetical protein ACOY4I_04990 [Bacillota bacterium]